MIIALSVRHGAEGKLVRLGVLHDLFDSSGNDIVKTFSEVRDRRCLYARHRQPVGNFVRARIDIDKLFDPRGEDFQSVLRRSNLKLIKKPDVIFEEEPNIIDAVFEHGYSFDSQPESES